MANSADGLKNAWEIAERLPQRPRPALLTRAEMHKLESQVTEAMCAVLPDTSAWRGWPGAVLFMSAALRTILRDHDISRR